MSVSPTRKVLIIDCNGIIKRYSYFYTTNRARFYAFDRFCNVLIESIFHIKPCIIYTTASSPIDNIWRRQLYPEYQRKFLYSSYYPSYKDNICSLDELSEHIPIINHIKCPLQKNESGDLMSSIIDQYTTNKDEIFILAQPKKFEQLLSLNDESINNENGRNINYMKTIRKDDDEDHELNFSFLTTKHNLFELSTNKLIIDYLSLIGIKSDNISGIKGIGPVRARKLLNFGNIPFLLENDSWKQHAPNQAKLIEENCDILQFFYNKLIPFDNKIKFDENRMNNITKIDNDYFEYNDSMSLIQSIQGFAEKYELRSLLWRIHQNEFQKEYHQKMVK